MWNKDYLTFTSVISRLNQEWICLQTELKNEYVYEFTQKMNISMKIQKNKKRKKKIIHGNRDSKRLSQIEKI